MPPDRESVPPDPKREPVPADEPQPTGEPHPAGDKSDWLLRVTPELGLLDPPQRRALFAELQLRFFARNWRFYAYVAALLALAILSLPVYDRLVMRNLAALGLPAWVAPVIFCVGIVAVYYAAMTYLWLRPLRRAIWQGLRARGVPICTRCGYDCRGLERPEVDRPRCPECGAGA